MRSIAISSVLAALMAGVIAMPAVAAERGSGFNARQDMEQGRIRQGVQQGDLRGNAREPRSNVPDVRGEARTFGSDGNPGAGERQHLRRDANDVSRNFHEERRDGERRFGYRSTNGRDEFRGRGHAYGRSGNDRRFWARGSSHRFGDRNGHPRFGSQWGHRSSRSGINRMQAHQHRQIARGVRSGELTHREARRLQAEQRSIRRQERAYLADGRLSRAERRDLRGNLRAANRHIYNQTHDRQTRR